MAQPEIPKLEWRRIEAGEYESEDGRFSILSVYDRLYGDHWQLTDNMRQNKSGRPMEYACNSLKHAKHTATLVLEQENGIFRKPQIELSDQDF